MPKQPKQPERPEQPAPGGASTVEDGQRNGGPHRRNVLRGSGALALGAAGATLGLSGCGKAEMGKQRSPYAAAAARTVTLTKQSWVGSVANVAVAKQVLQQHLGYQVDVVMIDEIPAWDALSQGRVDAILEDWDHADKAKLYCDDKQTVLRAGSLGFTGHIGWFVPKYFADEHPDVTDWRNLNKYAKILSTAESGGKGQLMDGSPAYVTNDEALVKNLHLDYKVVFAGSEAAQITQMRQFAKKKTPYLTYWYRPQWLFNEIPMAEVKLPKWSESCEAHGKAHIDCAYPVTKLAKYLNKEFARSNGKAGKFLKVFSWSEQQQNEVSLLIADKKMSEDDAAEKWVRDNPKTVKKWLDQL